MKNLETEMQLQAEEIKQLRQKERELYELKQNDEITRKALTPRIAVVQASNPLLPLRSPMPRVATPSLQVS